MSLSTYKPGQITDPDLRRETHAIEQAAGKADAVVRYQILHKEPAKYAPGDTVIADGTDWNPGSGEGMYRRNKANSAWVFVG